MLWFLEQDFLMWNWKLIKKFKDEIFNFINKSINFYQNIKFFKISIKVLYHLSLEKLFKNYKFIFFLLIIDENFYIKKNYCILSDPSFITIFFLIFFSLKNKIISY